MSHLYVLLAGALLGFGIAYWIWHQDPEPGDTRIVYVDKKAPPKLRVPADPTISYRYIRRVDTVSVRIPVPVDMGRITGVFGPAPISIGTREVRFQFWSPDSLRYIENVYRIRRPKWGAWLELDGGKHPLLQWYGGVSAAVRFKRLVGWVGYTFAATETQNGSGISFGLRMRVLGFY